MKKYLHTIHARVLLCTISMILLISIIIACISYVLVSSNLRQNLIQNSEIQLSFLTSSIDSNINNVKGFVSSCRRSSTIGKFAMSDAADSRSRAEARDYVMETYSANAALRSQLVRLVIVGNGRSDIVQVVEAEYSSTTVSSEAVKELSYFNELYEQAGVISGEIRSDPFYRGKETPMIAFVDTIEHPYRAGQTGFIFTEMSTSVIVDALWNYLADTDGRFYVQTGGRLYRYEDHGLVLCGDEFELRGDLSGQALSGDTKIREARDTAGGENCILVSRQIGGYDMYVTECLDEHALTQDILSTFFFVAVIILAAAVVIGVVLSWFLSRTVNVPVRKLKERMKRIEAGDFSRDPSTEWEHELGEIGKNINDLSENVLSLMNQRLADEREKKDYEYRMLQSQINPHFLYNTLNSIKWMATVQNAPGIAEMTTALSRMLKDIAKGTESVVPVAHELKLIGDYFTIQKYRYGGTIRMDVEIEDEALTECGIVKFTLQPIVENAIFHGIEPKGSAGQIQIRIYQDADTDVHIDVRDDGVGMDAEQVEHLLDGGVSERTSFFRNIGIGNVHKRLQYESGAAYGIRVQSRQGEYTIVSVILPYRTKETV